MDFSKRLKFLRTEKNISQDELAKLLGVSRTSITNYELGRNEASIQILNKLSEIFNCSIDYLLCKSDVREPVDVNKIRFANSGGLPTEGLSERDIEELKAQIEFKRRYNAERRRKQEEEKNKK